MGNIKHPDKKRITVNRLNMRNVVCLLEYLDKRYDSSHIIACAEG